MILITGGLGYLGGRIAEHLIKSGYQVRIGTSRSNVEIPFSLKSCEIVFTDLTNEDSLFQACKNITSVIHLASIDSHGCENDPELALLVNGLGTLKLLKAVSKSGVAKFLYFSTIHVYGNTLCGEIDELSLPRPLHPYSITHRLAEDYVMEASDSKKISGTVFRLSNAFGYPVGKVNTCWNLVVNDFCKQAVDLKHIILNSNGTQHRNFLPISDVSHAVKYWIENPNEKFCEEIFNLGGETFTVFDIASRVAERCRIIFGWSIRIDRHDLSDVSYIQEPLNYNQEKIFSIGCKLRTDINSEIDMLLKFLNRN